MKRFAMMAGLAATLCGAMAVAQPASNADAVPINAIQVVGTHNSYAIPADPRVMALMARTGSRLV